LSAGQPSKKDHVVGSDILKEKPASLY